MKISTLKPFMSGMHLKRFPFEEKEKFQPLQSGDYFRPEKNSTVSVQLIGERTSADQ